MTEDAEGRARGCGAFAFFVDKTAPELDAQSFGPFTDRGLRDAIFITLMDVS